MKKVHMTPKETAKALINRYYSITGPFTEAKQCALIAVEEIKSYDWFIPSKLDLDNWNGYWNDVIKEIENYKTYSTNTP
jgi:hypothetical protein